MPFFYFEGIIKPDQKISLKGAETRHIRLARKIRPGEQIELQDNAQKRYLCRVETVRNSYVECSVLGEAQAPPEPKHELHLAVAVPKEKALDFILQKSVELGAHSLYFFETEFSQRMPQGEAKEGKRLRWQKIMLEACKQCERLKPPELELDADVFAAAADFVRNGDEAWVLHQADEKIEVSRLCAEVPRTMLLVGPEGGFSPRDLERLPRQYLGLGSRILRSETAAIAGVALFQFLRGDMRSTD